MLHQRKATTGSHLSPSPLPLRFLALPLFRSSSMGVALRCVALRCQERLARVGVRVDGTEQEEHELDRHQVER